MAKRDYIQNIEENQQTISLARVNKLAIDVHNATPGPSGLSPEEISSS
jgi:hypothetical protein